jgi:CRP-like cAMP-binding protein
MRNRSRVGIELEEDPFVIATEHEDALVTQLAAGGLNPDEIRVLIDEGRARLLSEGEVLLEAGHEVTCLVLVGFGDLHVMISTEAGNDKAFAVLGEGTVVGWEVLLEDKSGLFTICAGAGALVLEISTPQLESLKMDTPETAAVLTDGALRAMMQVQIAGRALCGEMK